MTKKILINRNFAILLGGQTISGLGNFAFDAAATFWIVTLLARGQSWAPLAVSGSVIMAAIPTLVIGPFAGVFVDRWNKRKVLISTSAFNAILILLLLLSVYLFGVNNQPLIFWQLGSIYTVIFLTTVNSLFSSPSFIAMIGNVVSQTDQPRAMGLIGASGNLAKLLGAPLGALLYFSIGIQWALLLDGFSFVILFLAFLAVQQAKPAEDTAQKQRKRFLASFIEGIRFSINNSFIRMLGITSILIWFGAGAYITLDVFFVTQNLHAPVGLYAILDTGYGAGLIIGSLAGGLLGQRIGIGKTYWLSIMAWGVSALIYARQTSFIPALLLTLLLGVLNASFNVIVGPLILRVTPSRLVGRVVAILTPIITLASLISTSLGGYLDSSVLHSFHTKLFGIAFGPIDTIFTGVGILALIAGTYAMLNLQRQRWEDLQQNEGLETDRDKSFQEL